MLRIPFPLSSLRTPSLLLVGTVLTVFALAACDSGGGDPAETSALEIGFTSTVPAGTTSSSTPMKAAADSMTIQGSNGTLRLTDVRFVVETLELQGEDDSLSVNLPPSLIDLPLDTTDVVVSGTFDIPPGTYFKLEFEVDDLEPDDGDDPGTGPELSALLSEIRNDFPNWPADASMVAVGTFTPTGGAPETFKTFLEAEIEIERTLKPTLEVGGDGTSRSLTVSMAPGLWFRTSGGRVRDLSQYQSTNTLLEIENEFEDGVLDVETEADG